MVLVDTFVRPMMRCVAEDNGHEFIGSMKHKVNHLFMQIFVTVTFSTNQVVDKVTCGLQPDRL